MRENPVKTDDIKNEAERVMSEVMWNWSKDSELNLMDRIFKPFAEVDYEDSSNQAITAGESQMEFEEADIKEEDKKALLGYVEKLKEGYGPDPSFTDLSNWRATVKVDYTLGDKKFDIFSFLPSGYKILFCPKSTINHGAVSYNNKLIYVAGDLFSIGSLATIMHEVGHVADRENLKNLGVKSLVTDSKGQNEFEAEKLRSEKEASLFALRKLWPVLRKRPDMQKDVVYFLKYVAYASHISGASWVSDNDYTDLSHYYNDFSADEQWLESQEQYDNDQVEWKKFKESGEYLRWKQLEGHKDLNDDNDEFVAWQDWRREKNEN